jgi:hypothetical protein
LARIVKKILRISARFRCTLLSTRNTWRNTKHLGLP